MTDAPSTSADRRPPIVGAYFYAIGEPSGPCAPESPEATWWHAPVLGPTAMMLWPRVLWWATNMPRRPLHHSELAAMLGVKPSVGAAALGRLVAHRVAYIEGPVIFVRPAIADRSPESIRRFMTDVPAVGEASFTTSTQETV